MNPAEERTLLELFSVVNDVCTEPEMFRADRLNAGLGRIYRAWRRTRDVLAHQSYQPYQQRIPERAPARERESTTRET